MHSLSVAYRGLQVACPNVRQIGVYVLNHKLDLHVAQYHFWRHVHQSCLFKCSSLTTMESPETAGEETEAPVPMEPPTTLRTHNVYNFGQNSFGNSVGSPYYYPPYTTGYYPPYCCPTPETANATYQLSTTTTTPAKEGGHHEPESSSSSASTTNGFPTNHYTVALKVVSPQNKRDYQQHALRNIDPKVLSTPQELKEEISKQVGEAVPRFQEFPIGFYHESRKMWIQNKVDLDDAWQLLEKNKSLTLWCHGSRKKKRSAIDSQAFI